MDSCKEDAANVDKLVLLLQMKKVQIIKQRKLGSSIIKSVLGWNRKSMSWRSCWRWVIVWRTNLLIVHLPMPGD
nr:hypothetical protein [Tanacetum cinerariifolium]